jgi:Flagellar biosynthesis protein, FliO
MDMLGEYAWYAITAAIVLAAAALLYIVTRGIGLRIKGRRGQRLGISEYHEIDKMRRLVLVRRDGVEHLLLIGGNQDIVVETGIGLEDSVLTGGEGEADDQPRMATRPAPRPAVFGDRSPPPLRAVPRDEPRLRAKGPFETET